MDDSIKEFTMSITYESVGSILSIENRSDWILVVTKSGKSIDDFLVVVGSHTCVVLDNMELSDLIKMNFKFK